MNEDVIIVIPAFNEEAYIGDVVRKLKENNYDVIVVDDGSTDQTNNIARREGADVYTHYINRGTGAAIKTGVLAALMKKKEIIVTFDGDDQHSVEDIPKLVCPIRKNESDVVLGSRFRGDFRAMPVKKVIGNIFLTLFSNLLSGVWVSDSQCGLKAFSRNAAEQMCLEDDGYCFHSELLCEIKKRDLRVSEVSVKTKYSRNGQPKGTNIYIGLQIAASLVWRLFRKFFKEKLHIPN
jgi:glycosyltransferase involved in cell wall biosynthesis